MDARKVFLHQQASKSSQQWEALGDASLRGETQVETGHTVYRFCDGVCFSSRGRDGREKTTRPGLFGMRLVGFLTELEGRLYLSETWRRGSSAVLWRPGNKPENDSFVLTSATLRTSRDAESEGAPAAPPESAVKLRRRGPPTLVPLTPASMTRIHAIPADPLPELPLPRTAIG